MAKLNDLTNKRYGRLRVMRRSPRAKRHVYWVCMCDCGNTKEIRGSHLVADSIVSCGCYQREFHRTHGMTKSTEFNTWDGMRQRCNNPNNRDYHKYGGRGIKVCDRWGSFGNFLEDMGFKPKGKVSLDRIDNNGDYSPDNCRWATSLEQNNNMSTCVTYTLDGVTMTAPEWARSLRLSTNALKGRISRGWDLRTALTTSPMARGKALKNLH